MDTSQLFSTVPKKATANRYHQQWAGYSMQSHEARAPGSAVTALGETRANHQSEFKSAVKSAGAAAMEPRIAELEAHLKYIRRDMDEVRGDVKVIKHRLAYSAGATAMVLGLVGWVANSRFDQLVSLLAR